MMPHQPPPGMPPMPGGGLPRGGVFAVSEVLPIMAAASRQLEHLRAERKRLRDEAAEARALARKTRANLIVELRVWGNEGSSGLPITTSVERNEWADADPDVQRTELAADLAQTAAMNAGDALTDAQAYFSSLSTMLATERDSMRAERSGH